MKKQFMAIWIIALLLTTVFVGTAQAQGGNCMGDVTSFLACFETNNDLRIWHIDAQGEGVGIGVISGNVFPYAAAVYDAPRLMTRVAGPDGFHAELYFTGKQPAEVNGYDTTWTLIVYDPAGSAIALHEFAKRTHADASVGGSFAMAEPASGSSGATSSGAVPAAAPYGGTYEPVIVQGGTVAECLVRSTFTVRMREAPTTTASIVDRVPYDTSMPADMITTDGQWVHAFFVGEGGAPRLGWVYARYLDLSDACADITQVAPLGGGAAAVTTAPAAATGSEEEQPAAETTEVQDPTFGGVIDLSVVVPGTVVNCLVRTNYTVRMRAAPLDSAPVLDNIPYHTSMPADLLTSDGLWLRAFYLGKLGWIASSYLSLSEACADLNQIAPVQ